MICTVCKDRFTRAFPTPDGPRCNRDALDYCPWCREPSESPGMAGYRWHEGCLGDWARHELAAADPGSIL